MSRCFRSCLRFSIVSALIILPFSFTANSILLSTITDRGIQGAEPRLHRDLETEIANQAFNRFGFTYNGTNYDGNNINSFPIIAPSTTVSVLKSQLTSTFEDTLIGDDATDANGDGNFKLVGINDSDEVLAPQALSIKIRDGNNVDIADLAATKDKTFCELSISNPPPYKIEISNNLRLTTEYGDPRKKDYTIATGEAGNKQPSKQYSFSAIGLCDLRPASMHVYTGTEGVNVKYAEGYNRAKWTPGTYSGSSSNDTRIQTGGGFRPDSGFPKTGFYKAKFSLIGSGGDQSNYKCEKESGGDWVDYSTSAASNKLGQGCEITYNTVARPATPITIKMSYKGTTVGHFTIPVPTKWAIGMGGLSYSNTDNLATSSSFPALTACRKVGPKADNKTTTTKAEATGTTDENKAFRQTYLYLRDELTNSPRADRTFFPEGSAPAYLDTRLSRDTDVDGNKSTFAGEWGYLASYSGSGWVVYDKYWTAEAWSPNKQFSTTNNGYVGWGEPNYYGTAICRGEDKDD